MLKEDEYDMYQEQIDSGNSRKKQQANQAKADKKANLVKISIAPKDHNAVLDQIKEEKEAEEKLRHEAQEQEFMKGIEYAHEYRLKLH